MRNNGIRDFRIRRRFGTLLAGILGLSVAPAAIAEEQQTPPAPPAALPASARVPEFGFVGLRGWWNDETPAITILFTESPADGVAGSTPPAASGRIDDDAGDGDGVFTAHPWIAVDPPVDFRVERWPSGLRLCGDFRARAAYRVTARKGLPGRSGGSLAASVARVAWMPDAQPAMALDRARGVFRADGPLRLHFTGRNLAKVVFQAERLQDQNLVEHVLRDHPLAGGWRRFTRDLVDPLPARAIALDAPANAYDTRFLDLREILAADGKPPLGVYYLQAEGEAREGLAGLGNLAKIQIDAQWVTVSNLGLSARCWEDGALVWIACFADGRPAPGAAVKAYSNRRRLLASAAADADGLARLAWTAPLRDAGTDKYREAEYPALIVASLPGTDGEPDDVNYVELRGDRKQRGGDWNRGRPYLRGGYEIFVAAERGIYRPGDAISVSALVRAADGSIPPAGTPFAARLRTPGGKIRDLPAVPTDEQGRLLCLPTLPAAAAGGTWRVEFLLPGGGDNARVLGEASFRVADYMPQTIRLELSAPDPFPADGAAQVLARGAHLFGEPARGLSGQARAAWRVIAPAWPAWPGWIFGDAKDDSAPVAATLPYRLDADGRASLAVPLPAPQPGRRWRLALDATLLDIGGRPVEESLTRTLFLAPAAVGVKPPAASPAAGRETAISLIRVDADGRVVSAAEDGWKAELIRYDYMNLLRRDVYGRLGYQWTREAVPEATREGDWTDGRAEMKLRPERPGEYQLTVTDNAGGIAAVWRFHASGVNEAVQWALSDPEAVEIVPDRDAYRPGQTARLGVRAPFAGTALATIESDRVLDARRIELSEGDNVLDWTVDPAWKPNVFISVTLVRPTRPEKEWTPRRARGLARLAIDMTDRKLDIALDAPDFAPGKTAEVRARVLRADGRPARGAAVTVAAVDEGVLALTRFAWLSPWTFFHGPRRGNVSEADLFARLAPEWAEWENPPVPGGDGPAAGDSGRRLNPIDARRVRTAALFAGDAVADADGVATVRLAVPEYVGELRLMAWAAAENDYGAAARPVPVRSDALFRASFPRFAAPGDRWQVPVRLFNLSNVDGEATLRIKVLDGPVVLEGEGDASDRTYPAAALAAGQEMGLSAALRATGVGKAAVRLEMELNGAVYGETVEFAVRPAAAFVRAGGAADAPSGTEVSITVGGDFLPGTARAALRVGGGDFTALAAALETLLDYPHGCAEQTSARLMGLLALPDLAAALKPGMVGKEEVQLRLDAGVERLLACLARDARRPRLRMWPALSADGPRAESEPEYRSADGWVELFAFDMLVTARLAGFDVSSALLAPLRQAARDQLDAIMARLPDGGKHRPELPLFTTSGGRSAVPGSAPEDDWAGPRLRAAYACRLLAADGQPPREAIARLLEMDDRLRADSGARRNASGVAFLADAVGLAGDAHRARRLLDPAPETGAGDADVFDSPLREAAVLLRALDRWRPDAPEADALARRLLEGVETAPWRLSTQESAFALAALAARVRTRPPAPDVPVTVATPRGEEQFSARRGGTMTNLRPGDVVRIRHDAGQPVPARWWAEGVPADGRAEEFDQGLRVRRVVRDADGRALDRPWRFTQGKTYFVDLEFAGGHGETVAGCELLPAGLEGEPAMLSASAARGDSGAEESGADRASDINGFTLRAIEMRDDRVLIYGDLQGSGRHRYAVRAVTTGEFVWPAADWSAMYAADRASVHGRTIVEVAPAP